MSLYDTVHSLDSYTFIDEKQKEHVCFTAVMSSGLEMNRITYISDSASVTVSKMSIPTRNIDVITRTTTYIPRFDADGNAIVDGNGEMVFDYTVEESR
ncbi:MAG: hypothetical protein J6R59_00675 [Paludibacteraceae bacterium]|nr:hypothetical protein [Paludibacteraceae bacterium]